MVNKLASGGLRCLLLLSFLGAAPAWALCDNSCRLECGNNSDPGTCVSRCSANCQEPDFALPNGQTSAPAPKLYGAIALSPSTFDYGYATDQPSQAAAERTALDYCQKSEHQAKDCVVKLWYYNACGSLALEPDDSMSNGGYGVDWGPNRKAAAKKALALCGAHSASACKTELTTCSGL